MSARNCASSTPRWRLRTRNSSCRCVALDCALRDTCNKRWPGSGARSPDGAKQNPGSPSPHYASLHAGYKSKQPLRLDSVHAPLCPTRGCRKEDAMQGNVLVAQGGGPTAVINQSLAGVVCEARRSAGLREIYGAIHGVRGIVDEDLVNLTRETVQNLEMVALTPSAALGSTRDKPDQAYCKQIFRVLQAHEVGCFFYIGGNDSADTVRIVSEEARKASYDLRCVHIPKTIDNDLMGSDHVPGYPSAARFVVQAFMGLNLDNRSLPGVYVAVVMGRHAGFLTAASALAKTFAD